MKYTDFKISKLDPKNNLPFDLLLLADETVEAIEKYIYNSEIYIATQRNKLHPIAVFVLCKISNAEVEIKNIAVLESLQGHGIGSRLIDEIKRIAILEKYETIIVGTPCGSLKQIQFYEKNGFNKYGIRRGFYLTNYSDPIIENGIRLTDMVMLRLAL